jgi:ribosomal protein L20A (L18A)
MLSASIVGFNSIDIASLDSVESAELADESIKQEVPDEPKTVEETVKEYFKETPILSKVAFCESRYRQFDANGNVLRGVVNAKDVGVMQINEDFHLKDSLDLGLDIQTLEGNLAYAKHLYEKQGVSPWVHSSKCWSKNEGIALNQ